MSNLICVPSEEDESIYYAVNSNTGQLMGRVTVNPQYMSNRLGGSRIFAMNLEIDPELETGPEHEHSVLLKNQLLREAVLYAQKLKGNLQEPHAALSATYAGTDDVNIAYLMSRGFDHYESHYTLQRDLAAPVPTLALPSGIKVENWRMETEAEQYAYLDAYQSIYFQDDSKTIDSLQQSPLWDIGTTFTAFAGDRIVGSVAVWSVNQQVGITEYLFVRPEWRRQGVASCLLTEAMRYLRSQGVAYAQMQVGSHNPYAIAAFKKLGYKLIADTISLGLPI